MLSFLSSAQERYVLRTCLSKPWTEEMRLAEGCKLGQVGSYTGRPSPIKDGFGLAGPEIMSPLGQTRFGADRSIADDVNTWHRDDIIMHGVCVRDVSDVIN